MTPQADRRVPFGLPARVGGVVVGASAVLLAALAVAVLHGALVPRLDRALAAWLIARTGAALMQAMHVVSAWHAPRGILLMTVSAALIALVVHERLPAVILCITVLGGSTLNHLLKHAFQRARPGAAAMLAGTDFSFPSGHVANSTLLYGALAAWLVWRLRGRGARAAVVLAAAGLVALVGVSRVLIGAHYPSDVMGGALVGVMFLALCLTIARR